jgi:hypothetical protein
MTMAEEAKNSIVISKKNSGFPDYLDFDKLRREGIEYLGKLGGKIWTDHNVHDPGITILEMLCYALLDLGYRTNLPEEDIFARNPEDKSADNNFFTPAQILACNPLTITDFRKMLIDIEGVKNAWLEIATDQKDFCRPPRRQPASDNNFRSLVLGEDCIEYLNGLYHVYIDLEKNPDRDFENESEKKKYLDDLEARIRKALMKYRNLCEDFIDIYFLCKQEIGVCADISLSDNADPENVYINMVEKLRQFFSPSPQYYTLQQLLDKQKPIDEIFAGRPHNIVESHGFVDTVELEQLRLRKEIHLSDIYSVLLSVEGISSVRQLSLNECRNSNLVKVEGWKFSITENHVPEFSMSCSGFRFNRNEMPVFVDFKKFEGLFDINFAHNGKVLYQQPSPYLDSEIPKGVYRTDLGDYYSIQNEFPRVYGIAEGGLPGSASAHRKAQAYQLKSWLLFFDQLLANYLSQLQHLRSLFALSSSGNKEGQHTYFINQLTSVPDLQKLVRFNINDNNINSLGSEGSLMVFPVDREKLLTLKQQGKLETINQGELPPYVFGTKSEQDIAISQIKNDLYYEQFECEFVTRIDDCVYYYILTCSDEIALVSKRNFRDAREAAENASSVKYIGTFDENYRSFKKGKDFSFNIELNLLSFSKYLQLIVEDKDLFIRRRKGFLDHLLSRFAEQFTAYAQLSFGFFNEQQLKAREIEGRENYLSNYDDLSSNRGRAYDYLENNWNNNNLSGFEKKVKAISGMGNLKRHSLCNFEVYKYEEQYTVALKIAGTSYFTDNRSYDTKEEALSSAKSLFKAMRQAGNYSVAFVPHENEYELKLNYAEGRHAVYPGRFASADEARDVAGNLSGIFKEKDSAASVFESAYHYIPVLQDIEARIIRRSVDVYPAEIEAMNGVLKTIKKIDDHKKWEYGENEPAIGHLYHDVRKQDSLFYINTDAFKIDINNTIVGRPDKFTYELLDKGNNFKFQSAKEFENATLARANAFELISLMTERKHYVINAEKITGKFLVSIIINDDVQAIISMEFNSASEAKSLVDKVIGITVRHLYAVVIEKRPYRWRFNYDLGYDKSNRYSFHSIDDYGTGEEAMIAAGKFQEFIPEISLREKEGELNLVLPNNKKNISGVAFVGGSGAGNPSALKSAINNLLESEQEIRRLTANTNHDAFRKSVDTDEASRQGLYVYRLIDKDRVPAFYTQTFADKNSAAAGLHAVIKQSGVYADFLRICMGGDMIAERTHRVNNIKWYRYQVKSRSHVDASGESMVFFESVKKYADRKVAEADFFKYYLEILSLASVKSNYGKKISLEEIPIDADVHSALDESLVFVPRETLKALGTSPDIAVDRLVKIALSFPVRMVIRGSVEFNSLFPCEEAVVVKDDCGKKKEKPVFYFTYPSASVNENRWQSVKYFESPEIALAEFEFFLVLLKYPGNYFLDCDHCRKEGDQYKIYTREVLAESAERFATKEAAWGKYGVQKFICVSQSENAFHAYLDKDKCCHSFYVSCNNGLVYHPCKYDSPSRRDEVMIKLYLGIKDWYQKKSWLPDTSTGEVKLLNAEGKSFAVLNLDDKDQRCLTDRIADLSELILSGEFHEKEGAFFLMNERKEIILKSEKTVRTLEEWKDMLLDFTCYYPIVKSKDEKSGRETYCIEIKLPGFDYCGEEKLAEKPCGCGNRDIESKSDCYIAWKGRCCYATCAEAEHALLVIIRLLHNYNYYQPVFDCNCGPFGIDIRFSRIGAIKDQQLTYYSEEANILNWLNSELIAVNPQCYPYAEMACEAVARAKRLINSEGLHLVEHILLRPRCFPEDCRCPQYSKRCDDETDCEFIWQADDQDPCSEEDDICFIPGTDPYSFIATIALPAWPDRFRKPDNRKLIENILYQEAPAHVLLRILWLAPHDFCCFERQFKNWNRWLAKKKTCLDDFSSCEFLEFLFDRNYECLDECNFCMPCDGDRDQPDRCFPKESLNAEPGKYLSQINDLFCWKDQQCKEYEFIDCVNEIRQPGEDVILLRAASTHSDQPDRRKPQVVNARMNKYRTGVSEVLEKSNNNPIAKKTQVFLADPHPAFDRLSRLAEEIIKNKAPKVDEGKALTKAQLKALLEAGICYYIDKISFNGKELKKIREVKRVIEKLRKEKISVKHLYEYLDLPELIAYEPSLEEEIEKLFEDK